MDENAPPPAVICPTTGMRFVPQRYRRQQVCGHRFLWVWCLLCDACNRTFADPDFDPALPQVHCVELLEERAVGG